ncbi:conserved hypothetical protein [Trichinella spiralis]|nr:conserved hypothetical protein [Trichinella spiralis]
MEVVIRDYPVDRMLNGRVGVVQAVTVVLEYGNDVFYINISEIMNAQRTS